MVDVVHEAVERADPLLQARLDDRPLLGRDDARNRVEGQDALRALAVVVVDRERDAAVQERAGRELGRAPQLARVHDARAAPRAARSAGARERRVGARRLEHLVVEAARVVAVSQHAAGLDAAGSPVRDTQRLSPAGRSRAHRGRVVSPRAAAPPGRAGGARRAPAGRRARPRRRAPECPARRASRRRRPGASPSSSVWIGSRAASASCSAGADGRAAHQDQLERAVQVDHERRLQPLDERHQRLRLGLRARRRAGRRAVGAVGRHAQLGRDAGRVGEGRLRAPASRPGSCG